MARDTSGVDLDWGDPILTIAQLQRDFAVAASRIADPTSISFGIFLFGILVLPVLRTPTIVILVALGFLIAYTLVLMVVRGLRCQRAHYAYFRHLSASEHKLAEIPG